jgi:ribosome biogenesis GTPase A
VMLVFYANILTVFFSSMKLLTVVDARDPLFYRCPDLEVLLLVFGLPYLTPSRS